jgi:hypothetical protein
MPRAPMTEVEFEDLSSIALNAPNTPTRAKNPGAAIGWMALVVGWLWVFGSGAAILALVSLETILGLSPFQWAAMTAGILLPAFMVWFAGAAAQEGARARADASRLADAADTLINPAPAAEAAARRLAVAVRGEISALDRAIDGALSKLQSVDQLINDHARRVQDTATIAQQGAGEMVSGLDRERQVLIRMTQELEEQVTAIGAAINRQTRLIADAARTAEAEVRAADETLDARLSSFGAAAALISDRTRALSAAAKESGDSANRLEGALHGALEVLAKATTLTDAARRNADEASLAANATAGAVRETTSRAVEEARRAAEHIRSHAPQRTAAFTPTPPARALEPRQDEAVAPPAPPQRSRWSNLFAPKPREQQPPIPPPEQTFERPAAYTPEPAPARRPAPEPLPEPSNVRPLFSEDQRPARSPRIDLDPPDRMRERAVEAPAARAVGGDANGWTWRDLLAQVDAAESQGAPPPARASFEPQPELRPTPKAAAASMPLEENDAIARLARSVGASARNADQIPAVGVVETAGIRLPEVFSIAALDRIAHRARNGSQARRRAVKDAAGEAVARLGAYLAEDSHARQEASGFLNREGARIAELLGRGRASMSSEATRAFLLLDAAVG